MQPPQLPDIQDQDLLATARSDADQALKEGQAQTQADYAWAGRQGRPAPQPVSMATTGPGPAAQDASGGPAAGAEEDYRPAAPEEPAPQKPLKNFQGFWDELGNRVGEGLASAGKGLANIGWGALTQAAGALPGDHKNDNDTADAGFKAIADTFDPAIKYYQDNMQRNAPQTSRGAQILAGGLGGLAPLALGPEAYLAQATMNSATDSMDAGQDLKTTYALAGTALLANAAGMSVPFKSPNILKRILANGTFASGVSAASEWATKEFLRSGGYQDAADKVDPLDPASLITSGLMGAIFGFLTKPGVARGFRDRGGVLPGDAPTPGPARGAVPADAEMAPGLEGEEPAPPAQIPDHPTPEPVRDIQAQVADMKDPATPRKGVYLSAENRIALGDDLPKVAQGTQQMRNFDGKGGMLLVDGPEGAKNARAVKKANGDDIQKTLGQLTGAGEGKTIETTVVVQGQTPAGAVASEGLVKPEEVPAKTQQMVDEGKTPVVTTPEAAQARRAAEVEAPVQEAPQPAIAPEPVPEAAPKSAGPERVIVKTGGGERGAIVQGESAEGKTPVMLLNEEGEPSGTVVHAPDELIVRGQSEPVTKPPEAPVAPAPQPAEPTPAPFKQLTDAMDVLRDWQEAKTPGRAKIAKTETRAGNLAGFARALKDAANKAFEGKLAEEDRINAAVDAAKKVENLDLKPSIDFQKSRGVNQKMLDWHRENMLDAARALMDPDYKPNPPEVPVRAEKIKAQIAKERAATEKPNKPATPKPNEPAKVKVAPDQADEAKAAKEKANRPLTSGEKLKLKAAGDAILRARTDETREAARTNLERVIAEVKPDLHPDDAKTLAAWAEGEARDRAKPKTRDEEIDDEFGDQRYETTPASQGPGQGPLTTPLGERLDRAGFTQWAERARDAATPVHLHEALDRIIDAAGKNADSFIMGAIAKAIRRVVPNMPVRFVDRIIDPNTAKEREADWGLHSFVETRPSIQSLQVRLGESPWGSHPYQILMHEAIHGALRAFMFAHPDHPFTNEIKRLLWVARRRAVRMERSGYDLDTVNTYGLKDEHEFLSEALSNEKFMRFLNDSDQYWSPGEKLRTLGHQLADAIRSVFGMPARGEQANLFNNVLDISGKLLTASTRFNANIKNIREPPRLIEAAARQISALTPGEAEAVHSISSAMQQEPDRALPHENIIRTLAGDKAGDVARDFNASVRGRVPQSVRRVVLAGETHDQIMRSNTHWFGSDTDTNPMNQLIAAEDKRAIISGRMLGRAGEISRNRGLLSKEDDYRLGALQRDATTVWGIDPSKDVNQHSVAKQAEPKFAARYDDFKRRWDKLSPDAQAVFTGERDYNEWASKQMRKAAIDVALDSYSDRDISPAQRSVLYSARSPGDYEALVGTGKLIDVQDRNEGLLKALNNTAPLRQSEGPYFPLGRHGDLVVQMKPEGDKAFGTKEEAQAFAQKIRDLSPRSTAKVEEIGGKFNVNYKADYVSMHTNMEEAQAHAEALRRAGFDVGPVTQKVLTKNSTTLAGGVESLITEATRRLTRNEPGPETDHLIDTLKKTYASILATRSAYAASKLARKGTGGVKPEEMGQNFAQHAQSLAWNTSHLASMFQRADAMGRLRDMAKNPDGRR